MVKFSAFVLTVVAFTSYAYAWQKNVYWPTRSCEVDFYQEYAQDAKDPSNGIAEGEHYTFEFIPAEYDALFTLVHSDQGSESANHLLFGLYKLYEERSETSPSGMQEVSESEEEQNQFFSGEAMSIDEPRHLSSSLTAVELENLFIQKERKGQNPLLSRNDIYNALQNKELSGGNGPNKMYEKVSEEEEEEEEDVVGSANILQWDNTYLKGLSFNERPKLYVTDDRSETTVYALKEIDIEMPTEVYATINKTPIHIMVTLDFRRKKEKKTKGKKAPKTEKPDAFTVQYPVYAKTENVELAELVNVFVRSLAEKKEVRSTPQNVELSFLIPALTSIRHTEVPIYRFTDAEEMRVLANCEYIYANFLESLFKTHHLVLSNFGPEAAGLPVQIYTEL